MDSREAGLDGKKSGEVKKVVWSDETKSELALRRDRSSPPSPIPTVKHSGGSIIFSVPFGLVVASLLTPFGGHSL